jgi:GNAT superfamily N-acetyltransferase
VTVRPRKATTDDLPAIRQVVADAYARYTDRMDRPPAPVLNDYRAATEAGQVWVIGTPISGVIVLVIDQDSLLIESVAVTPAAQGRGLGRLLMEFAEQQASELGLRRLTLYTNEIMTENLAIYRHLGYREIERCTEHTYRRVFMEKPVRT